MNNDESIYVAICKIEDKGWSSIIILNCCRCMTPKLHIFVSNVVFLVPKSEKLSTERNPIDKALLDKQHGLESVTWPLLQYANWLLLKLRWGTNEPPPLMWLLLGNKIQVIITVHVGVCVNRAFKKITICLGQNNMVYKVGLS